ncbi:restriction endonuclease-like protein [Clostridioides difficile]
MDLQASGNNIELVFIETQEIYFSIKGNDYSVGISDEAQLKVDSSVKVITSELNKNMYFKEYKNYEIIIESKKNSKVEFYHDNSAIRDKVTPTGRSGKMLSGIINFRGDIGYSDLYVFVNGREHLKVTVEVFPSKIDYKDDYKAILNDVNEEIYNLAYGFLSRTYLGAEISNNANSTYTEFYSILNYVYDKLLKSIDIIINNPHHELVKESRVCKYHSLRNSSMETVKWLEKRPHVIKNIDGRYIPTEALQVSKSLTYNTNENRFLKFILLSVVRKIENFIFNYNKLVWKNDDEVISKLSSMKKQIIRRINTTFLKEVSESHSTSVSLVFSMASGYREVYKYYLMLQKGLNINSNILAISMKDLPLLYEYWCFIKINSLLRRKYKLISSDFIKINNEGIVVALRKGVGSTLVYENPRNGERFEVLYNSTTKSGTLKQKPDNILSINKERITKGYQFVFDAKYKVDYSAAYANRYGGVGPREEDINTMHRYRDAIVYKAKEESSYKNCVFGAFVLFPFKDEEKYKEHDFYKSIEEVNIGGIPFLPSSTKLMEEFLDVLINESSYSTFERYLEPIGRENYIKEEYYANRNVLVGSLRNREQLEVNLRNSFYHTKCTNVNLMEREVKYVALAQSKKSFGEDAGILYFGKVNDIELIRRSEIKELPSDSDKMYLRFNIEEWYRLSSKIQVQGYQVRKIMYTTEYLIMNAGSIEELCIKERDEFRNWCEGKRLIVN